MILEHRAQMSASRKYKRGTVQWRAAYLGFIRKKGVGDTDPYNTAAKRVVSRYHKNITDEKEYNKLVLAYVERILAKAEKVIERM